MKWSPIAVASLCVSTNSAANADSGPESHGRTAIVVEPLLYMSRYGTWIKFDQSNRLRAKRLKSEETEFLAEKMKQAALKCCMWIQGEIYEEDYE